MYGMKATHSKSKSLERRRCTASRKFFMLGCGAPIPQVIKKTTTTKRLKQVHFNFQSCQLKWGFGLFLRDLPPQNSFCFTISFQPPKTLKRNKKQRDLRWTNPQGQNITNLGSCKTWFECGECCMTYWLMVPSYLMGSHFLEVVGELGGKGYQEFSIKHCHLSPLIPLSISTGVFARVSWVIIQESKLSNNLKRHNLLQSFMNWHTSISFQSIQSSWKWGLQRSTLTSTPQKAPIHLWKCQAQKCK